MKALKTFVLEKETEAFIEKLTSMGGPPLYKLTPVQAREMLEKLQSGYVEKPRVKIEEKTLQLGPRGKISLHILRPEKAREKLPTLMYFHGGGWILGSFNTHERLVCELCVGANANIVFVNYSRSPESKYPVALEEAYAATKYIAEQGKDFDLDPSRLAVVGDSVGGNMAIAITLLAKERKGPKIDCQVLFYPVTSSDLNTPSYEQFSEGPWLAKPAMEWFWNAYEPDTSTRKKITLSPLRATIDQLKGLPPALVINGENDVLRDEGEAYAHKLMQAGVNVTAVRFLGTIHDFVMLNPIARTPATRGAIALAISYLQKSFKTY